jgi:ubiquitin C-terminal hydrolase
VNLKEKPKQPNAAKKVVTRTPLDTPEPVLSEKISAAENLQNQSDRGPIIQEEQSPIELGHLPNHPRTSNKRLLNLGNTCYINATIQVRYCCYEKY